MSFHIEAKQGEIAEFVLLPGDPLRAKYISEKFLENSICYNKVRGMYGYTGYYKGKKISVQGTGMGIPSISIYVNELINDYGANTLLRLGTCGAANPKINPGDIVFALAASSNSSLNNIFFEGASFAPCADFDLLRKAWEIANNKNINAFAGNVLTSDIFYNVDNEKYWEKWAKYGILALEMEAAGLYTIAARYNAKALALLTVSDSCFVQNQLDSLQKEKNLNDMIEIALEICI